VNGGAVDHRGALEAVERILNRGGSAYEVLSAVLEALHARGVASGKVRLAKNGRLVDGPTVGSEAEGIVWPVFYEGTEVGSLELAVDDAVFVERVATLISPYVVRLETSGDR
jgi:hypothetical protein